jgi:hypothetical protein
MAAQPQVAVVGLRALIRDFQKMSLDTSPLNPALIAAGKAAAAPIAVAATSALPKTTGTLAGDVRSSGTRTGATVRMGRAKIPYAGWVEFGGDRPDGSSRPFYRDGRFLFPAARGLAETAAVTYSEKLGPALEAFAWSNTGTDPTRVAD